MIELMSQILPWVLSFLTIWMTVLAGNKHSSAWLVGLINQVLWMTYIVMTHQLGLIPMNIALSVMYLRNHFMWGKHGSDR